jgi:RNA polymerase sigma-70 factor, ECF subfamily
LKQTDTVFALKPIADKADFEKLFKLQYSHLCAYANTFLKDQMASEEVVQEVMFKVWVNRESLEIKTSVQSYLFRAVRNGCLNVLKHVDIREEFKAYNEAIRNEPQRSHEEEVIISELEQKIRHAIDLLPMERKKVFILSRYEGLSYSEIASELGISVKTVENQVGKALKFLREELADYLPWLILFFFDIFRDK